MGCCTACRIFEIFSTTLAWICQQKLGLHNIAHVLNDFLFLESTELACQGSLNNFMKLCEDINIPLAPEKTQGPAQVLTFLGIELDTIHMQTKLLQDKLLKCRENIQQPLPKWVKHIRLHRLQSIIGLLNFACRVIAPGRAFFRGLINLTQQGNRPHHFIKLTRETKEDLRICIGRMAGTALSLPCSTSLPSGLIKKAHCSWARTERPQLELKPACDICWSQGAMTAHVMTPTVCILAEHYRQPTMAGLKPRFIAWGGGSPMPIRNKYGLQNQDGGRGTMNREIRLVHPNQALMTLVWTLKPLGLCEENHKERQKTDFYRSSYFSYREGGVPVPRKTPDWLVPTGRTKPSLMEVYFL